MRKESVKKQQAGCTAGQCLGVQSYACPFVAEPARPVRFRGKTGGG